MQNNWNSESSKRRGRYYMKKYIATLLLLPLFTITAYGAVKYDNEITDINTFTITYKGELMLEARKTFDTIGFECNWDNETKSAVFEDAENKVVIAMYSNQIYVNDELYESTAVIENDTLYIPANLLDQLGLSVTWDYDNKELLISNDAEQISYTEKEGWNSMYTRYYHNDTPVTGENYINGLMYSFDEEGTLNRGIYKDEYGTVKGYNDFGFPYYGFVEDENKTYYFKDGKAIYSTQTSIDGKMYNFNAEGYYTTGWYTVDGVKYYNNSFGYPEEGVVDVDGVKYLFIDGIMQTGVQVYGGKNYFLYNDGVMLTNKIMGDYYYDINGVGTKLSPQCLELINTADNILNTTDKTPYAIYSYVSTHIRYKFMEQLDWTSMARNAFSSGRGACYNYAACMDILMKRAGYETRVVRGTGTGTGLHYWNQVKIDGVWTNIDACNKHYNVTDAYLKSLNYTFDKYEYPEFK